MDLMQSGAVPGRHPRLPELPVVADLAGTSPGISAINSKNLAGTT